MKPAVTPTKPGCSGSALAGNRPLVAGLIDRLSTAPVRGADGAGSITGPPGPNALSAPAGGVGQPFWRKPFTSVTRLASVKLCRSARFPAPRLSGPGGPNKAALPGPTLRRAAEPRARVSMTRTGLATTAACVCGGRGAGAGTAPIARIALVSSRAAIRGDARASTAGATARTPELQRL